MKYDLSLEQRKQRFLESCCGSADIGGGEDMSSYDGEYTDPEPSVSKLDKIVKRRRKRNNGR